MRADSSTHFPSRLPAVLAGVLVLVATLLLMGRFLQVEEDRQTQIERGLTLQQSAAMRARIERELNATLYLMNGLSAYVSVHEDLLEGERVEGVLRAIYRNSQHLRNVGLAPDNVLRYVYPYEGNEAAIGLRYENVPEQWPAVRRAMEERRTVMVGPIELVQGGRGLIVRTPVYLEDDRYWGVLTLVIDSESLFEAAGFSEAVDGTLHALRWAPTTNPEAPIIRGDPDVFDRSPVIQQIVVPGGHWELASLNVEAADELAAGSPLLRATGWITALLLAVLAFLLVDRRIRAAWQALHDPLTRLPNRRMFRTRIEKILRGRPFNGSRFAVAYIDLNGFKAVNDTHGHSVGDRVLAEVGRRLSARAEDGEMVARLGGDEFAMLIERADPDDAVRARVDELLEGIGSAGAELAPDCPLGAAAGVAFHPDDGDRVEVLLAVADQRMYVDKRTAPEPGED